MVSMPLPPKNVALTSLQSNYSDRKLNIDDFQKQILQLPYQPKSPMKKRSDHKTPEEKRRKKRSSSDSKQGRHTAKVDDVYLTHKERKENKYNNKIDDVGIKTEKHDNKSALKGIATAYCNDSSDANSSNESMTGVVHIIIPPEQDSDISHEEQTSLKTPSDFEIIPTLNNYNSSVAGELCPDDAKLLKIMMNIQKQKSHPPPPGLSLPHSFSGPRLPHSISTNSFSAPRIPPPSPNLYPSTYPSQNSTCLSALRPTHSIRQLTSNIINKVMYRQSPIKQPPSIDSQQSGYNIQPCNKYNDNPYLQSYQPHQPPLSSGQNSMNHLHYSEHSRQSFQPQQEHHPEIFKIPPTSPPYKIQQYVTYDQPHLQHYQYPESGKFKMTSGSIPPPRPNPPAPSLPPRPPPPVQCDYRLGTPHPPSFSLHPRPNPPSFIRPPTPNPPLQWEYAPGAVNTTKPPPQPHTATTDREVAFITNILLDKNSGQSSHGHDFYAEQLPQVQMEPEIGPQIRPELPLKNPSEIPAGPSSPPTPSPKKYKHPNYGRDQNSPSLSPLQPFKHKISAFRLSSNKPFNFSAQQPSNNSKDADVADYSNTYDAGFISTQKSSDYAGGSDVMSDGYNSLDDSCDSDHGVFTVPKFSELNSDIYMRQAGRSRVQDAKWSGGSSSSGRTRPMKPRSVCSSPVTREVKVSKMLSKFCRHTAEEHGLVVVDGGYLYIEQILSTPPFTSLNVTQEEVLQLVRNNDKQRFSVREDEGNWQICANQGHTMSVSGLSLVPITSVDEAPLVVHGTYNEALDFIQNEGLSRMKRTHIHFAPGTPKDQQVISGIRGDCDVYIYIDLATALADGYKFYKSVNNVILCPGNEYGFLPPKYFSRIVRNKSNRSNVIFQKTGVLSEADQCENWRIR